MVCSRQLRLVLLIIERTLEGSASAPLLLSADLGGGLPMWSYSSVHITESALASPQPLLAAGYTLLTDLITQNLRRATFHPPLYLQALTLLHRLLVAQHRASQKLPLLRWSCVWEALFKLAEFISQDDVFAGRGVAEVWPAACALEPIHAVLDDCPICAPDGCRPLTNISHGLDGSPITRGPDQHLLACACTSPCACARWGCAYSS